MTIKSSIENVKRHPVISFSADDFRGYVGKQDDPMMISMETMKFTIKRVLVDQGSSADILFWTAFKILGLSDTLLRSYAGSLVGFAGYQVNVRGYVDLMTKFGKGESAREITIRYLVVGVTSSYNIIQGRLSLNLLGAVVSTPYLTMKYPVMDTKVGTIRADQKRARQCYNESLKITKSPYVPTRGYT